MNVIIDDKITELTPELLAVEFWEMNFEMQARFYNHLDHIAESLFPFQLQEITEEDGLLLSGRRVMQSIGEYSHWGLTPSLRHDGVVK